MAFLKLLIMCVILMNECGVDGEEQRSLKYIVCDNFIDDGCSNSVTLSQVSDELEACKMTMSCEPNHCTICCNSTCYNSVEIIFGSDYHLSENYTLIDLDNVLFGSLDSYTFTISCTHDDHVMNTGFTFIAVRNLTIQNLKIIGCGKVHNSTSLLNFREFLMFYSSVFIQNSTNITLKNVNISDSYGTGLSIIDTNGTVEITGSIFSNNAVDTNRNHSGGGGIYVEFTECTPGVIYCNPAENQFNKYSLYYIENCLFEYNIARHSGSDPDYSNDIGTYIVIGYGGGMLMYFFGQASFNTLYITSSNFSSNQANQGGGLSVSSRQNASHNQVYVTECLFHNNVAFSFQGGGASIGFIDYQPDEKTMFNHFTIHSCRFVQNEAPNGAGGGLSWYGSEPIEPTNSFVVNNSTFFGNKAQVGFAMQVNDLFHLITNGRNLPLIVKDCNFTHNGVMDSEYLPSEFSSQTGVGTVSASGVGIRFQGHTMFVSNYQTALVVDRQQVEFYKDSATDFEDNHGLHGGGILLMGGAWIKANPNSTVTFFGNTAVINGAAICAQLMTPFDFILSHSCFFRYSEENVAIDKWNTSFRFFNDKTGSIKIETIFITTLHPCQNFYSPELVTNEKPFCFCEDYQCKSCLNNTADFFATSPAMFCNLSNETFHVIPGKVENMNICVRDELNNSVDGTQFTADCIETNIYNRNFDEFPNVLPAYRVTQGQIQIVGKPGTICQLQLQTITDFQITRIFNVSLLNCPPGLFFNNASVQCECLTTHRNHNPAVRSCDHFQAYINPLYWIGYELDNNTSDLLMARCPLGYCYKGASSDILLPSDVVDKDTLDHLVCNPSHRTGRLCSQCVEGYSVAINSPTFTCEECKNDYKLGILYLFLSYFIPVSILFYIIMAYDIKMTTGTIGAFLFFSQIVGSHYHSHLMYSININKPLTLDTSNILYALYSISNLVFFNHDVFSFCLFKGAGTADMKAFELLLSFYPVLLIIVYFLMRKYCHCYSRFGCLNRWRFSHNAINHGVCGFLILCFVRITLLTFSLLIPEDILYANETKYKTVVYLQRDMEYFKDFPHTLYAASSLLILVIIIAIPTLILLLHPIMIKIVSVFGWGDSRVVLLINACLFVNKLKPIIDSFLGDYKDNFRYFAGLQMFLYKIVFFFIMVVTTPEVTLTLLLLTIFMMVITLIHILVMPFKRYVDNAVYSMIYVLLLGILVVELYTIATGKFIDEIIWLLIVLSSMPLSCFIMYCIWKLLIAFLLHCGTSMLVRRRREVRGEKSVLSYFGKMVCMLSYVLYKPGCVHTFICEIYDNNCRLLWYTSPILGCFACICHTTVDSLFHRVGMTMCT